jgi:hypothetical protein
MLWLGEEEVPLRCPRAWLCYTPCMKGNSEEVDSLTRRGFRAAHQAEVRIPVQSPRKVPVMTTRGRQSQKTRWGSTSTKGCGTRDEQSKAQQLGNGRARFNTRGMKAVCHWYWKQKVRASKMSGCHSRGRSQMPQARLLREQKWRYVCRYSGWVALRKEQCVMMAARIMERIDVATASKGKMNMYLRQWITHNNRVTTGCGVFCGLCRL